MIGFIGLGVMGEPMALNLVRAGVPLVVWNRSSDKSERLRLAGAQVATEPADVFHQAQTVILMLANGPAIDAVLQRGKARFHQFVSGHTIIAMGTVAPEYSKILEADILVAGGSYVEAPVSGSRKPAEQGALVAMLAGAPGVLKEVQPLLSSMCQQQVVCGPVPSALLMKLAVNTFLISLVTGLAEAFHFANAQGLDLKLLQAVLNAGPMASQVSSIKAQKLIEQDFSVQASISDVLYNNRLITAAAKQAGIASPLLNTCQALYEEAETLGQGHLDMAAVIQALKHASASSNAR
jgi:3-hydroxyisobutyrate dehydrogenase